MRLQAWLLLCLLAAPVHAAPTDRNSETVTVTALAVAETPDGFLGVSATVQATVLDGGTGQVFVSTKPLADTDMQGSARLAARVAANLVGVDWRAYDYLVEFRSASTVIGGPSAGGVMSLALATALHNVASPGDPWTADPTVAATGTINPDGTIGPVGGVPAKAEAAKDAGISLFLYPAGLDTAFDRRPGPFGLQDVAVDMQEHCADLGITCRPAATLEELVEASAHVRIERPTLPVPSTTGYGTQLEPSVQEEVDRLAERLAQPVPEGLAASERERVDAERAVAEERLEDARGALSRQQYYLAASWSFQGHISMGRAEALARFHAVGESEQVVQDTLAACDQAVDDAAEAVDGQDVQGVNGLHALAAAEDRVHDARALQQSAGETYRNAFRFEDWVQAMFFAAFCEERAATAVWWLEAGTSFGQGPPVEDVGLLLQDVLSQAQELVAYAQAVTGSAGDGAAQLQQAFALQEEGYLAGALAAAVEAQTSAAVRVQTAAGGDVPPAVLDAARAGAAQAIEAARAAGAEPLLPVSLVELAGSQEDSAVALANLWSARTLALIGATSLPSPTITEAAWPAQAGQGYSDSTLVASLGIGAILGASLVAIAWVLRRP